MTSFIKYIDLGPWPGYVAFTTSKTNFEREMKRLGIKNADPFVSKTSDATMHTLERNGDLVCVIACSPAVLRKGFIAVAALLAHECLHVIEQMRDQYARGRSLGSEAESYLLQYLLAECLRQTPLNKSR